MANTTAIYARIDTELKKNAEGILSRLGITPASAIQMFYSQIILHNGLPFSVKLPDKEPVAAGALTRDGLNTELMKGVQSLNAGKGHTAGEVDKILAQEFDV